MVSATHTNITPAKLEEFEATFKHFDKDDTNVSPMHMIVKLIVDIVAMGDAFRTCESGHCLCRKFLTSRCGGAQLIWDRTRRSK